MNNIDIQMKMADNGPHDFSHLRKNFVHKVNKNFIKFWFINKMNEK